MSIHHTLYCEPPPELERALGLAEQAIACWTVNTGDEELRDKLLDGWSGIGLREHVACAILEAQGYDTDALEDGILRKIIHAVP